MSPTFIPPFPAASTVASKVDVIFYSMLGLCGTLAVGIFLAMLFFTVRYHKSSNADRTPSGIPSWKFEITWTVIPLFLMLAMFVWGGFTAFEMYAPPEGAIEMNVVGKQWMWKFQHPNGRSEINELHVPVGKPVKLLMISQDVIHSLFVPAFRIKQDVLPGRYTATWFQATKTGDYHLFCSQYCGTDHAGMGKAHVIVMEQGQYQAWLGSGNTAAAASSVPPAAPGASPPQKGGRVAAGEALFNKLGCVGCHVTGAGTIAPSLAGLFGATVQFADGSTTKGDENYIRGCIINPNVKVLKGYNPVMPSFQGRVTEEELQQLIDYIKSLSPERPPSQ